ncbi:NmrA family NAD(P)-binding protein, partial [Enterococcus faecium]|uniref:NmrA family NAD(P)-binding protein n=1 Tax=Enterococcus faecium TaxID=1352 RepID=UPI0039FCB7D8
MLVLFKNERMIYMKVAVLGATGKEGQLLLAEAKRRGMDVTAIVRNASKIT